MRRFFIPLGCLLVLSACNNNTKKEEETQEAWEKFTYPETKKENVEDTYFGEKIIDPYRWLEDDQSPETEAWVKAQNAVTFGYLHSIPFRDKIKAQAEKMWNHEELTAPFDIGDYTYYYKNNGLQNQNVLYRKDKEGKEEVFLDPNTFAADGTTSLAEVNFSKDGSLVCYLISEGGSDWRKAIVLNTKTKEQIGDTIVNIKYSGGYWHKNDGFYYCSYDKPKGSELSEKTDQNKLYYHKLGTAQSQDKLIFGGTPEEKNRFVGGYVSNDENYLVIRGEETTSGGKLWIKDLRKTNSPLINILNDYSSDTFILSIKGDKIYLQTNLNAPNGKVVVTDVKHPTPENWRDVIPETDNVLTPVVAGRYILAHYMKDAISQVKQYDFEGKLIREIELPSIGTAAIDSADEEDKDTYFTFENYYTPLSIYKLHLESGETELYWTPKMDFNPNDFESKQVFYTSKDGTKVPMIITYKKGTPLDGTAPTTLYGYGGFNISYTPWFAVTYAVWMNNGGIFAVANIRGGGEYGTKWHDDGTKFKKQNVFDDFIAACQYLIDNKYTSKEKLAIKGGSNGGLLIGAVMTQRPDLMRVALPYVGVMDMLRYHKFTSGAGWAYDYGTSDDSKEMFQYLKGYSPVHNVKEGTCYPATLIFTGDHDDRVVPAHSFKFAAQLQSKQSCKNPVFIRIETNAGHGAGTPVSKIIDQMADWQSFALWNMGYKDLPNSK
ncbi:prolyl oligopeptidase family protein [Capnocytophaga sp. oral taxon 338]|uniref:prolyl oligopeptidase family serine peptidase n=1 Tax=Capnocytophaga sp. oral taxon 338 TaxID=710239 RepID=UPI000202DBCC|nr:prolyl oligopeptidase family serine peptidase [Capnocytophaga sp. oral taxon 338]EGD33876.1 prolyl endopeptidase Pep [Capnocytophaga sp. oral taxon 338 str. F0234]